MTSNFDNFTVYSFVQKKTCGFCQMTSQLVSRLRSISKEQMLINSCKIQNEYLRGNSNKTEVKNLVFPLKKDDNNSFCFGILLQLCHFCMVWNTVNNDKKNNL